MTAKTKTEIMRVELLNRLVFALKHSCSIGGIVEIPLETYDRAHNVGELMDYVTKDLGRLMGHHISRQICDEGGVVATNLRRDEFKKHTMEYQGGVRLVREEDFQALCQVVEEVALDMGAFTKTFLAEMYD